MIKVNIAMLVSNLLHMVSAFTLQSVMFGEYYDDENHKWVARFVLVYLLAEKMQQLYMPMVSLVNALTGLVHDY